MQPLKSQTLRTIHESSPKRHLKYQCPIIKSSSILSNTKLPKSPIQLTRQIYETAGNLRRLNRVNRISRDDFRVFVAPPYRVGGASRLRRSHLSRLGKKSAVRWTWRRFSKRLFYFFPRPTKKNFSRKRKKRRSFEPRTIYASVPRSPVNSSRTEARPANCWANLSCIHRRRGYVR